MNDIYKSLPLDQIPWNMETAPQALIKLVEEKQIQACKAIDLGCGAGNYAIYLAGKGFDVTGIDLSQTAINYAINKAQKENINCHFKTADILGDLHEIKSTYDFAYNWGVLHHILPDKRKKYLQNVVKLLNPEGKHLSVCFAENDPQFGGEGKVRKTKLGSTLYFSSEQEILDLFDPYFEFIDLKTIEISGKFAPHMAIYAFMKLK